MTRTPPIIQTVLGDMRGPDKLRHTEGRPERTLQHIGNLRECCCKFKRHLEISSNLPTYETKQKFLYFLQQNLTECEQCLSTVLLYEWKHWVCECDNTQGVPVPLNLKYLSCCLEFWYFS